MHELIDSAHEFLDASYDPAKVEFGGYDATLSVVMGVHQSIGMKPIHMFGSDEQKARFLPDLASGRKLAAFGLTEPQAGSDAYNVRSYAEQQADGSFVLNGEKRWIGNGAKDVVCAFARCENGHVALILEKGMDGFEAPHRFDTLGLLGNDLRKLTFNNVRVPKENMLGEPGAGFRIAMSTLNNGRMSLGTGVVGGTKALIKMAIEHTQQREQSGMPLAEFELVEDKIGWMVSYLYGLESLAYLRGRQRRAARVRRTVRDEGRRRGVRGPAQDQPVRSDRVHRHHRGLRAWAARARTAPRDAGVGAPETGRAGRRADQTKMLRASVEKLLRTYGKDVQLKQRHQKRLADAATDIYAQVATMSRTTALFEDQGVEASGQEGTGPGCTERTGRSPTGRCRALRGTGRCR